MRIFMADGDDKVAVSLLLVRGKGYKIDYLFQGREVDKSDLYESRPDLFQPGEYCFYWPGAVAMFGGGMLAKETPSQAFAREMGEELPELKLSQDFIKNNMTQRTYHWKDDVPRIMTEAEEVFQGNVGCFFGPDLDSPVPTSALGPDRDKLGITYGEWLNEREEDHYFVMNVGSNDMGNLKDREGAGAIWLPHWVARSLVSVPCDKVALLDDMVQRVRSGELEIMVKR